MRLSSAVATLLTLTGFAVAQTDPVRQETASAPRLEVVVQTNLDARRIKEIENPRFPRQLGCSSTDSSRRTKKQNQ
jgi:hypothetical protein